jgi:hypothetical protein
MSASLTVQLEAHDSLLRTDLEDLDFRASPVEDYQGRIDLYKLCVCRVPARPVYQTTQLETRSPR